MPRIVLKWRHFSPESTTFFGCSVFNCKPLKKRLGSRCISLDDRFLFNDRDYAQTVGVQTDSIIRSQLSRNRD
jgi:hypothetical protein